MKSHKDITKEIMEMVEDYSMAGLTTEVLEIRIRNLLLMWEGDVRLDTVKNINPSRSSKPPSEIVRSSSLRSRENY